MQDYPIYAEIPETSFSCDGRSEGGYYADTEAECQPFHVCSADPSSGGLVKYSFLCPNGTLFNQEHFVCEYWFNVDCSSAESFYGLNDNIGEVPDNSLSADASSPESGYASPSSYESPSVAASSPVGYSAPSSESYSPPSSDAEQVPEYSASRTGRLRQGKKVGNRVNNNNRGSNRQSGGGSSRRVNQSRFRSDSSRRGKSNDNTDIEFDRTLSDSIPSNSSPQQQQPSTRLNEVNVNRRRPKNNKRPGNNKKLKSLRRGQAVSNTKLSPPSSASVKETRRGKKVSPGGSRFISLNDRRKGRQELSTGYLPPVDDVDNSLSDSDDDYVQEYEEEPLPSYSGASQSAPESSYVLPDTDYDAVAVPETDYAAAAVPEERYETPEASYGVPEAAPEVSYDSAASTNDLEYEYEEEPLPTYNSAASALTNDYSVPAAPVNDYSVASAPSSNDYSAPAAPVNDYSASQAAPINDYYAASAPVDDYSIPEDSYIVPEVSNDVDLAAEVYAEDVLPSYNNGVYSEGSGNRYKAPVAPSIPADSSINQEDVLPQYNNGVYTSGSSSGDSYTAPSSAPAAASSYNSPSSYSSPNTFTPSSTSYASPSSSSNSFTSPPRPSSSSSFKPSPPIRSSFSSASSNTVPGSYQDPSADILPEYHKSEISLGLHNKNEVPRIEPFSNDFGEPLYIGTYKASGSAVKPVKAAAPTLDTGYGVPAGPTLSDYNIPDISDKGFSSGGSSYGR